jgi:TPP-dependent pyruvate/acetoin dehydrogenase alpha subunit
MVDLPILEPSEARQLGEGLRLYGWMALARELDDVLCAANPRWFPSAGEEAAMIGAFCDLRADDAVAPHYRDPLIVYLMRGADIVRLTAQVLGKSGGYNKGRSVPFLGPIDLQIVPWVAGDLGTSIGVATGAALAFQHAGSDRVCVCSFGDGTSNRGDFHENINLAASWRLPIVFVCQNNGWAISQSAPGYLPASVASRAAGYGIPGIEVDGNDLDAVRRATTEAVARARAGAGPSLIEAKTWRARGHWAGDPQEYRAIERETRLDDPLVRHGDRLIERNEASAAELERLRDAARSFVAVTLDTVRALPDAGAAELGLDEVCP